MFEISNFCLCVVLTIVLCVVLFKCEIIDCCLCANCKQPTIVCCIQLAIAV